MRRLKVSFFRQQVKIWFQNRRMKWKRSKKAQQEAKEKKSSTSSSSSSSSITASIPPSVPDVSLHKNDTTHHSIESGGNSCNSLQKNLTNLDQHRHSVNLMPNMNDFSNMDDNVNNNGIMRRPLFIPEQNGDMFRPYVV